MPKIALVTDSTAYIPKDLLKKHDISVAPQILIWGDKTYEDDVDIKPQEFYSKLSSSKVMPTTSQVTPSSLHKIFVEKVESGSDVLAILLSSKLSGTIQSAVQARELMGKSGEKVHIVDSLTTAMAMGFIVLLTARAAERGANLQDCIKLAEMLIPQTGVFFAVDTLEFLHRGGRIGGAQRFIGSALNMKPILGLVDGKVEGIDRIRTKSKAHDRILELTLEKARGKHPIHVATLHANAPDDAKALLARAEKELNPAESIFTEVSPVVGNHAGPGTVGLAFLAGA